MKIERRKNVQFNEFHGTTLDWKVIRINKIKHLIHIVENFIFKRLRKCKILFPYKNSRVYKARVGLKLFTTLLAYKQVFFFGAGFFEIVRRKVSWYEWYDPTRKFYKRQKLKSYLQNK